MDKNKIIEAAGKLVAKGAYDKAIKEYQKILDVDPKDVRILQKMGELYQKKNDNNAAATYIVKVAESYAKDGFFLKAVAQYKQVLKLDPSLVDINLQLAELHQQLQLMGEAMAYYQVVANHYDKQGDVRKSLDVLRKMVDLDPDNVQSRVKLADLYVRERMNDEAVEELSRAADHLKRQNRIDDYLRVAERISALKPDDLALARELAELYLQRNDQKRALAKLQICFKADSRDIDTLKLLAVAFQGLGQTSKTISVFKELARAYEGKGRLEEAEQTWAQVAQLDPNDPDVLDRAPQLEPEPISEVSEGVAISMGSPVPQRTGTTANNPAYSPGTTAAVPVHTPRTGNTGKHPAFVPAPAKPRPDSLAKLLTETDVYVKYGLHDKALEHLRKVFSVEPENIDAHEKAYAIYVSSNNHAQASEQLLNVLRLHTRLGDKERAQPYLATILQQNAGHPEVPVFVQALRVDAATSSVDPHSVGAAHASSESGEDAILVDSTDNEVIVADEPISAEVSYAAADDLALTAASSAGDSETDFVADRGETESFDAPDPYASASHEDAPAFVGDDEIEAPTGPTSLDGVWQQGEFEAATAERRYSEATGFSEDAPTTVGLANPLPTTKEAPVYEPASFDDFVEASTPAARGPRSTLTDEEPAPEAFVPEAFVPGGFAPEAFEGVAPQTLEEAVVAPPDDEPAAEECDEATFFIEQGLFDEAREILETVLIAYPEHQRAAQLLAQVDQAQSGGASSAESRGADLSNGEPKDAFDLAQELANELGEFDNTAPTQTASDGGDYQVSVEEVFAEFKKGLEKVVKPEDVDTHYDLGIAYKEMGLIDDAISEFTIARKGCIGKRKEIDCLTMAGMLQVMKGDYPMAVDSFLQALTSEHATGDVERATRFELAAAYEGAGQPGRALAQYIKVQAQDPNYRDVSGTVERLSAVAVPEEDQPVAPKKGPTASSRKVGYV